MVDEKLKGAEFVSQSHVVNILHQGQKSNLISKVNTVSAQIVLEGHIRNQLNFGGQKGTKLFFRAKKGSQSSSRVK
jgi:hypothetical protein